MTSRKQFGKTGPVWYQSAFNLWPANVFPWKAFEYYSKQAKFCLYKDRNDIRRESKPAPHSSESLHAWFTTNYHLSRNTDNRQVFQTTQILRGRSYKWEKGKWSPQSLHSDESPDRSKGLLESKVIPESRPTPPQTLVTEDFEREVEQNQDNRTIQ